MALIVRVTSQLAVDWPLVGGGRPATVLDSWRVGTATSHSFWRPAGLRTLPLWILSVCRLAWESGGPRHRCYIGVAAISWRQLETSRLICPRLCSPYFLARLQGISADQTELGARFGRSVVQWLLKRHLLRP